MGAGFEVKRIVLSGVESVGKSRLAADLARAFGGVMVPEYGREFTEALDRPLTLEDHRAIAIGHAKTADAAALARPALLVEDTDIVMTTAWATMLFGERDALVGGQPSLADLHLLLLPDVPFVADSVRMFGSAEARLRFHSIVVAEFAARKIGFVPVGGDWAARFAQASAAVRELLR